jgi:peptidyl-dipeptidase A
VPRHLKEIGLLRGKLEDSKEQVINAQMAVALSKIAILPWTYMIDLYRWRIMSGGVKPSEYQSIWEDLMKTYQGIVRPFPSGPDDFDAGSKYHVPANVPYVRFVLFLNLQILWCCHHSVSTTRCVLILNL